MLSHADGFTHTDVFIHNHAPSIALLLFVFLTFANAGPNL